MLEPGVPRHHRSDLATVPSALIDDLPGDTDGPRCWTWLQDTYTGSIGYEYEHLEDPSQREWLREQIESGAHRQPLSEDEKQSCSRG
jgi:hypothetical protein